MADTANDDGPSEEWAEGFDAGFGFKESTELRLECLREAVKLTPIHGNPIGLASQFYKFVTGQLCDDCGAPLDDGDHDTHEVAGNA